MANVRPFADFDYRTIVGAFKPTVSSMLPTTTYYGLGMQVQYVYGYLGDAAGNCYVVERKFMGSMTGGCYVMSNEGGQLGLVSATSRSARGELRRTSTPTRRRWSEPVMQRLAPGVAPADEQPLAIEISDSEIGWDEGDILHLEGTTGALGVQAYAPMPEQPWFYSEVPHRVSGVLLGKQVRGIAVLEQGYWPTGIEPKEFVFYAELERSFNAFGNLLDDGTMQWGMLVNGGRGLSVAAVVEDRNGTGTVVTATGEMEQRYQFESTGNVEKSTIHAGETVWDFHGDKSGWMVDFAKSRWGGYGSQAGVTTRRGDSRSVEFGYGWFEYFADRIPAEHRGAEADA
jgi:hypothetical protein